MTDEAPQIAAGMVSTEARTRARGPLRPFAIRAAIGLALVAILLWYFDARPIFRTMARERAGFFIATVAVLVAGQAMSALRWRLLALIAGIGGPFREYLAYYFSGMFTNVFVPGLIGGDALRAVYLGRRHGKIGEAVASVIADRGIGLAALFWLAAGCALAVREVDLPPTLLRATVAIGAATLAAFFAAPFVADRASRIPGKIGSFVAPLLPYLERPVAMTPAILLSLLLQTSLSGCQYLLALGLGLEIPLVTFLLIVPIANVAASLPLTINGLGLREAAYVVLFAMAGVAKHDAIALSLLYFAATLACGLTGAIAFVTTGTPVMASMAEPPDAGFARASASREG
jgi:uncharacterized membrane protein YbhN (UPF0104 family)